MKDSNLIVLEKYYEILIEEEMIIVPSKREFGRPEKILKELENLDF